MRICSDCLQTNIDLGIVLLSFCKLLADPSQAPERQPLVFVSQKNCVSHLSNPESVPDYY